MNVGISRLHFPVTTLGPGHRIGIWFQGCSIRCPGCISADTWGFGKGMTTVNQVLGSIWDWLPVANGITISGGEPFDQADALIELLGGFQLRDDQDVLVYTGYAIEDIESQLMKSAGLIDALISDPFVLGGRQTMAHRGSDNQRVSLLTDKGRHRLLSLDRSLEDGDHSLDVMFDASGVVWLAGIPKQGDLQRLKHLLSLHGHHIQTTESTRGTS